MWSQEAVSEALSTLRWVPFAWLFLLSTLLALTALICRNFSVLPFRGFYQSSPKTSLSWVSLSHNYFLFPSGIDSCLNKEKSTVDPSYDLENIFQPQHPALVLCSGMWFMSPPFTRENLTNFSSARVVYTPECALLGAGGNLWGFLPSILLPGSCLSFGVRCFAPLLCHYFLLLLVDCFLQLHHSDASSSQHLTTKEWVSTSS